MSEPALVVDVLGLRCPMPVLELARRLDAAGLAPGSEVELVSDDPAAGADVPAWAAMRGHEFVDSEPAPTAQAPHAVRYRVRLGG